MTKVEKRKMDRLEALLLAEQERADKSWTAYRETLYELVDLKMKLQRIEDAMDGDE